MNADDNQTSPVVAPDQSQANLIKGRWFGLLSVVAAVATYAPSLHLVGLPVVLLLAFIGLRGGLLARKLSVLGLVIAGVSALITFIPVWANFL